MAKQLCPKFLEYCCPKVLQTCLYLVHPSLSFMTHFNSFGTMASSTVADRARIVWSMRLSSAIRTALACAIVGGATLCGPKFLANQIKFAAFSYLTALLIVSDATLGETLKGCCHAFCATTQVVPLAVLGRPWIIDPTDGLPFIMAAVAVGAAAFVVALPRVYRFDSQEDCF